MGGKFRGPPGVAEVVQLGQLIEVPSWSDASEVLSGTIACSS
jgi:hypothetical protein